MWIEQRRIQFAPLQARQKGQNYVLESNGRKLEITARQHQYWEQFQNGLSIHQLVKTFIGKGLLVSFREISELLELLLENSLILNPEIQSYFAMSKTLASA